MPRLSTLLAFVAIAVTGNAHAHAHLQKSEPADQSIVTVAPKHVQLLFAEPVEVTALTLQVTGGTPQKLGPLSSAPSRSWTIALPTLAAGSYVVSWRAVSDDRHVMTGAIHFRVDPTALRRQ